MVRSAAVSSLVAALLGCATSTPGAQPHDMSAAGHEREAAAHGRTAEQHAAAYDPNASTARERCRIRVGGPGASDIGIGDVCWTSVANPTEAHLRMAEKHRRHAVDHRAASAALRDAEARACAGIAVEDRDLSPFEHVEDIASVEPLVVPEADARAKLPNERTVGAVVTFRAVPGLTAEWLQRIVDCHLARNASLGHVVPEMPDCPLVPEGVGARVSSAGAGFAVAIRSDDLHVAKEVLAGFLGRSRTRTSASRRRQGPSSTRRVVAALRATCSAPRVHARLHGA